MTLGTLVAGVAIGEPAKHFYSTTSQPNIGAIDIGTADVEGEYADIYALGWVSHLRTSLAAIAVKLGMEDIGLSSLERAEPRLLTQHAGRSAFEVGYAGICYQPRDGHSIENWAIFEDWTMSERFPIHQPTSRKVAEDDPDLLEALRLLGLVIGD